MNDVFSTIALWFYILLNSCFCIWFFVMLEKSHEQTITILSLRIKELKDNATKKGQVSDDLIAFLERRNDFLTKENDALKKRLDDLTTRRAHKTVALPLPETPYSTGPLSSCSTDQLPQVGRTPASPH